ncbi:MAG TPA: secretin N-terminal domain-containing protein [Dissulfurispiraceae bacterium]|nr:secretin N-terminal domain-containing protein [Dissulfurispiraceae bacterium]
MGGGGGSSFFFDDADVFEVAQTVFGDILRVNYIIDPQVKGRVNFRTTTPIPREKILPVMEIILRLNGIAIVEENDLYRIIPIGNIAKEPAPIRFGKDPNSIELKGTSLIQIVPLTYINSSEMMSILQPLLTQGGAIYDISKRNILMIADTDANIRRLLQVVNTFDDNSYKSASQPKIYVYPLQNSKAEHVAKILQQVLLGSSAPSTTTRSGIPSVTGARPSATPQPQQPSPMASAALGQQASGEAVVAPGTKIQADEVSNSLVIFASPGDYALILAAVKQLDNIPRQVMIEAVVASLALDKNLTFGVRWNLDTDLKFQPFKRDVNIGGTLGFQDLSSGAGAFGYLARDSHGNARLALQADLGKGDNKILSAPQILVADNREARIQVGSQVPIATSTTTSPIGTGAGVTNTTTSTIQYKDTGTILKVKPQVNDSGLIALEISQEVSDFRTIAVYGTEQVVIDKSEVTTNLIAQDGQTIVIGGLIGETNKSSRSGIPLLSEIPILGHLFGTTQITSSRNELVVLLTPRVLRNQEDASKLSSEYYDVFKNLDKELKLDKLKKTSQVNPAQAKPVAPAPEKPTPQMKNEQPATATPQMAPPPPPAEGTITPEPPKESPLMYELDRKSRVAEKGQPAEAISSHQEETAKPRPEAAAVSEKRGSASEQGAVVYHARVCSFKKKDQAVAMQNTVERRLAGSHAVTLGKDGEYYTVRVHGFASIDDLKAVMEQLRIKDFKIGKTNVG